LEVLARKGKLLSLHKRQLELARLSLSFETHKTGSRNLDDAYSRRQLLLQYICDRYRRVSCFDDVRRHIEALEPEELQKLIKDMRQEADKVGNPAFSAMGIALTIPERR
jgi:hypothetical protein